jgi:hypothetical protein
MYAWRPGGPRALRLVENVWWCTATRRATSGYCLDDFGARDGFEANLFAGRLGDGTVPLRASTASSSAAAGLDARHLWIYPGGARRRSCCGPRGRAPAPETLHILDLGASAPPRTLGTDVTGWSRLGATAAGSSGCAPSTSPARARALTGAARGDRLWPGGAARPIAQPASSAHWCATAGPAGGVCHARRRARRWRAPGRAVARPRPGRRRACAALTGRSLPASTRRAGDRRWSGATSTWSASTSDSPARPPRRLVDPVFSVVGPRTVAAAHWERTRPHVELIDSLTCQSQVLSLDGGYELAALAGDRIPRPLGGCRCDGSAWWTPCSSQAGHRARSPRSSGRSRDRSR